MASTNQGNRQGNKTGSKQSGDTSTRGFASMDPQRQRDIASAGGRAAHEKGTAHEFTPEEARRAGAMSHKNDGNRQSAAAGSRSGGNRNQPSADTADNLQEQENLASQQGGNRSGDKA
ncbi:KGG domain-containing protein [Massilia sp. erpn]|uniref:KGG domain-containing protein n=1 Tax=Massilia sp. erpn TaxID=2738142 RepID=UPI002106E321|nr:KGG domain-containing protein [Massilia sp. erpn]UTY58415.1 hypothetical protein HPQ68_15205 [Massilia sp. erpn]